MRKLAIVLSIILACMQMSAQNFIPIWAKGKIPNSKGIQVADSIANERIYQVGTPGFSIWQPSVAENRKAAILIIPGGGYARLSHIISGSQLAKWFNTIGVTAFVLQHRLPQSPDLVNKTIAPLQDAQRAFRYIRAHAAEWGLDPNQIGVMGISAGGHVASSVATHTEDLSAIGDSLDKQTFMPNFSVLISPVISMTEITHKGSHDKLLGEKPSDAVVQAWSSEKLVSAKTCPSLLFHASDDHVVNPMNSILYYSALLKNGVSASLHIFPHGDHKIAILCNPGSTDMWPALTKVWLEEMNILTPLK